MKKIVKRLMYLVFAIVVLLGATIFGIIFDALFNNSFSQMSFIAIAGLGAIVYLWLLSSFLMSHFESKRG